MEVSVISLLRTEMSLLRFFCFSGSNRAASLAAIHAVFVVQSDSSSALAVWCYGGFSEGNLPVKTMSIDNASEASRLAARSLVAAETTALASSLFQHFSTGILHEKDIDRDHSTRSGAFREHGFCTEPIAQQTLQKQRANASGNEGGRASLSGSTESSVPQGAEHLPVAIQRQAK